MPDKTQLGRRVAGRLAAVRGGGGEVAALRERVTALENDVQESRRLNQRVAELLDVVQELLVPVASRDEALIAAALEKFQKSL